MGFEKMGYGTIIIDVDPPKKREGLEDLTQALTSKLYGFEGLLDITCNSGGFEKYDPVETAHHLEKNGFETIFNLNCRDFTEYQIQEKIKLAKVYGLENAIAVQGDRKQDVPYKMKSSQLIRMLSENFYTGSTANPFAEDKGKQLEILRQRQEAGAKYLLTQPLFYCQTSELNKFKDELDDAGINIPLIVGVWITDRNSVKLKLEGIKIPEEIKRRLEDSSGLEGRKIAAETIEQLYGEGVESFYLIPPKSRKISELERFGTVIDVFNTIA